MHWANLGVLTVVILSVLWGLARGMIREFFGVVGWVGGVFVAWRWGGNLLEPLLQGYLSPEWVRPVAYFALFFAVLATATVLSFLLRGMLYSVGFSIPDRIVGGLFGLLRAAAILALVIFLVDNFRFQDAPWWRNSWLGQARIEAMAHSVTAPVVSYWEYQTREHTPDDRNR